MSENNIRSWRRIDETEKLSEKPQKIVIAEYSANFDSKYIKHGVYLMFKINPKITYPIFDVFYCSPVAANAITQFVNLLFVSVRIEMSS